MDPEMYEKIRERLLEDICQVLETKDENPVMEKYRATIVESYFRSLEMLERLKEKWQD